MPRFYGDWSRLRHSNGFTAGRKGTTYTVTDKSGPEGINAYMLRGDDQIFGGSGNDVLRGYGGTNRLDGGDGPDQAAFLGTSDGFTTGRKGTAYTVTDKSGQPVPGAEISGFWMEQAGGGRGRSTKSGEDGRYRLAGLGEVPLRQIWVRAKGFGSEQRQGANPGDTLDFVLERTGTIVGKVLLADSTAPPAFQVKAHPEARASTA